VQTVTARHPDAVGCALRRAAAGVRSRLGAVNTSYQVGSALRFAAAVAGVAAHLALGAIRRPSTAAEPLAVDQPLLERIA
jgi:hypothetical protein